MPRLMKEDYLNGESRRYRRRCPKEYRDSVLPPGVMARVAVEHASTFGWERFVDPKGHIIGMETFGTSAPLKDVQKKFGFLSESVAEAAKRLLGI